MLNLIELTRRLIDIPSVTGEEAAVAHACEVELRRLGFEVSLQEISPGRPNVLAVQDSPRILLCTHLDTVPPFFKSREARGWIYGRGACDTKGILAAMLGAVERLGLSGVRDVGVLLLVGEETDSIGAKRANAELPLSDVRYTIVGEPTESKFARAQKGGFTFTLSAQGKAAHSGYPQQGQSALTPLLPLLSELEATFWGEDPTLGGATVNIGVLQAGTAANVVPDAAVARVLIRVVDSVGLVRERLHALLQKHSDRIRCSEGPSNNPVQLMTLPGAEQTVVAFNTDIPHLTNFGKPLLMGPGSILDAHSATERIAKQEILKAVELYEQAVLYLRTSL